MLPRPGEDDARGELVFVSYSHGDAEWAQRFGVLLKPLLRNRRLRLWVDTAALRGGDEWHPEIEAAIARSAAALVLVSADYLASDFCMDDELPALVHHRVRLLPVLVGACFWEEVPALAQCQWLHDPGRDGPLGRDAGHPSRRDERMVDVCRALLAALPRPADPGTYGGAVALDPELIVAPAATAGPVAEVPAGLAAGALSGVPDVPPGYVVRDELAALIDAVIGTATGAVGVTAEHTPFGLLGQGGIGKSVLAAALGRDDRIRHRFPDGVFWVTLGERADVLAAQLDLLTRLGSPGSAPRTIHDAVSALRDLLRERRALLLVDDVWSDAAALAFRVTGPQGRVVYTTRELRILTAVRAREYPIGVLSAQAARAVAVAVLGVAADALPAAADGAFDAIDRVALAVALLAAAVRGGRSWDDVTDTLRAEVDVYGDHPYANTFKAMQIAVAALPTELATALLGLAVFPPDTAVPVAAVARYWARPRADTARDLDRLAGANLLRRDGDTIGFHDLQHDYLLLHSPGLPALHADLLRAYRALLPEGGQLWQLPPDEPYIWDHLVAHLVGAGERSTLAATVTDPAYLVRRIDQGGLHATEADLKQANGVLTGHPVIAWWQHWLARHADVFSESLLGGSAAAASVAATMNAWLRADPTRPPEAETDRLAAQLTHPYIAVRWGIHPPSQALRRVLTGHTGWVRRLAWSPDGNVLASGNRDGTVGLWDTSTGALIAAVTDHVDAINSLAWSPDGASLASGGDDWRVRLRSPITGRTTRTLHGHSTAVTAIVWSSDGTQVAAASRDGAVRVWAAATGRGEAVLTELSGPVLDLSWSERYIYLATHEDVYRWQPTSRHLDHVDRLAHYPQAATWSTRGHKLAIHEGNSLREWSSVGVRRIAGDARSVQCLAWSPDGAQLATGHRDYTLRVWNASTDQVLTLSGHRDWVRSVAWSPDGIRLASGSDDHDIRIWSTPGDEVEPAPQSVQTASVSSIALTEDGRQLATAGSSGDLQVWEVASGRLTNTWVHDESRLPKSMAWTLNNSALVVANAGRGAMICEPATGCATTLDVDTSANAVAWSTDGSRLATMTLNQGTYVWNRESGDTTSLDDSGSLLRILAWSRDALRLAACDYDGRVRVWDVITGRVIHELDGSAEPASDLAWSPDGTCIAVVSARSRLQLWYPASERISELAVHAHYVAWAPDGCQLALVRRDGAVVVVDRDGSFRTWLQLASATCVDWRGSAIAVGQRTGPAVLELRTPGS